MDIEIKRLTPELIEDYLRFSTLHRITMIFPVASAIVFVGAVPIIV